MKIKFTKQDRLDAVDGLLVAARREIEKLIESTSYTHELEKLSGILADLKLAKNELESINWSKQ